MMGDFRGGAAGSGLARDLIHSPTLIGVPKPTCGRAGANHFYTYLWWGSGTEAERLLNPRTLDIAHSIIQSSGIVIFHTGPLIWNRHDGEAASIVPVGVRLE